MFLNKVLQGAKLAVLVVIGASAASAQPVSELYGSTRGWDVEAVYYNGQMTGCMMSRPSGQFDFGLIKNRSEWYLAFPSQQYDGYQENAWVAIGNLSGQVFTTVEFGVGNGLISQQWINAISSGSWMNVEYEGGRYNLSLSGTSAAIALVSECDANNGLRPQAQPRVNNAQPQYANNCPVPGSVWSPQSQGWGNSTFYNYTNENVELYWIDFSGNLQIMADLYPGQNTYITSTQGHLFLARGYSGYCYGGVIEMSPGEGNYSIQ